MGSLIIWMGENCLTIQNNNDEMIQLFQRITIQTEITIVAYIGTELQRTETQISSENGGWENLREGFGENGTILYARQGLG